MHDPLCFEFDKKDDDCFDHSLESPFCYCELIARVREDERLAARYDVARVIMEMVEGKRELNPAFFDAIYAAAGGTVEQEQP